MTRLIARSALALLALQPAALLMAAPDRDRPGDEDYVGESPERYAMVRRVEGEVRIRKGDQDDMLERGVPVGEGDVVESRGRGVLQLADGTRIGFAGATRFTVAALFKDDQGRRQVLLRLDYGRIRIAGGDESEARVRVDCPSGSARSEGRAVFTLECERDRTARLKVFSGRAVFATNRDETELRAGERVTVYSPEDRLDRIRAFNTYDSDEFERWADDSFIVRRGSSWDRVPSELRYYSDELDESGDWVEVADYGWCWRPRGVSMEWRPYWQGRWGCYGGGMTWVSSEPWGYVTYHHGRWDWRAGFGWIWIPGLYYSPAWVAWNSWDGYCGWAPLGYHNYPATWGYGAWNGYHCWNVVPVNHLTTVNVNVYIRGERHLIASCQGTGVTTWNGVGPRPTNTPWVRTPVILRPGEANNSALVVRAMRREEVQTRLQAYDRQAQVATGRTVLRQNLAAQAGPGGRPSGPETRPPVFREAETHVAPPRGGLVRPGGQSPRTVEHIDRPRDLGRETGPVTRPDTPRTTEHVDRPRDGGREGGVDRREGRTDFEPRNRDRFEERRSDPAPRERTREDRPRFEERRQDPVSPRERPHEDRPRGGGEERRSEPAPRQESRPAPREESRPAPPPRQESHPAPRQESRPAPREERRGGR